MNDRSAASLPSSSSVQTPGPSRRRSSALFRRPAHAVRARALGRVRRGGGHAPGLGAAVDAAGERGRGAAGAVEASFTILALERGVLPPTINQEVADPECDLDYIPNEAREQQVEIGVSNSFGFGGTNSHVLLEEAPRNPSVTTLPAEGRSGLVSEEMVEICGKRRTGASGDGSGGGALR